MTEFNYSPAKKKTPIDILVPAHDHLDLTARCVTSIYENTQVPFHLIVIDDSTDTTPLYFKNLQQSHDNITYIHSDVPYREGNQFFNIAFSKCRTPYMATVMNSITVEPDWEMVALDMMENDPKIGVIGFKCIFSTNVIESAGIAMSNYTPIDLGRDKAAHRLSVIYEVTAAQWAFALVRKEAAFGVIEEGIFRGFVGWDDIDNCFAIRRAGWKIFYDGMGVGYHESRATRGSSTFQKRLWNLMNAEAFYKRWGYWDAYKIGTNKPADYKGINELAELRNYEETKRSELKILMDEVKEAEEWTKKAKATVVA